MSWFYICCTYRLLNLERAKICSPFHDCTCHWHDRTCKYCELDWKTGSLHSPSQRRLTGSKDCSEWSCNHPDRDSSRPSSDAHRRGRRWLWLETCHRTLTRDQQGTSWGGQALRLVKRTPPTKIIFSSLNNLKHTLLLPILSDFSSPLIERCLLKKISVAWYYIKANIPPCWWMRQPGLRH